MPPPSSPPIICFGQQPCGFFPKRFLVAKIQTARRLQKELGGGGPGAKIIFFYHDADHDPRETKTILRHIQSHQPLPYNFDFENKIQRKFSPLFLKRVPQDWHKKMCQTLPNYVPAELVEIFKSTPPTPPTNVADFCLEIYRKMGLLEGIRIARSGDPVLRAEACNIDDCFVDTTYQNETVRARYTPPNIQAPDGNPGPSLSLHEGGNAFINLPLPPQIQKSQITPTRDTRLKWMQSVLHCTHYVAGAGEQQYLNKSDAPDITYIPRDPIDNSDEAWTELP